ncbi:MAG: 50S ribosomal protein L3 [Parcubacteria group bacterium GW2011_GWA2_43_17]|nr:MAG: 50S ribosomal protein L3 [Parcubacteria group bacterium GW2011_GWA2_43_17]KKT92741.1 MAG: 50S ribosomal protein L3 [Parcubacteria group bacterium GW2011_GWF2_45_11]KKT96381.1 MAG: 50S ribosomal protein L3 [Parcubacteria group bacterium GW2011_GWC2_45_15]OGY93334.1 MAG: 50S ribosomal protein L3 [Candidatus Komeilibacteria bacterium RIFOXYC2_FULL_45_12]OGY94934.1 MAG: 50S ribosomal protein L3 [Candidatus Komeilibacteria bacterium RIFOXYA2_FULL_45_9]HAH03962.1 50S ribosomal protein L3 [Ca
MKFILGSKIEMSQLFADNAQVIPVTIVKAGPCLVTQVKEKPQDGYRAVQIGFGARKKLTQALLGHLKGLSPFRYLREFKIDQEQNLTRGQEIKANVFQPGDLVKVTGVSKGKGFQGPVKRHGFSGSLATHGHKDQLRMPGSIGATAPAHIFKGTRMAGRMGGDQVSLTNLEIVKVDSANNLLYIKGALPGPRHGLLLIQAPGELRIIEEVRQESAVVENIAQEPAAVAQAVEPQAQTPESAPAEAVPEPVKPAAEDTAVNHAEDQQDK